MTAAEVELRRGLWRVRSVAARPTAPVVALLVVAALGTVVHLRLARGMVVFGDELGWAQRYRHLGSGTLELWGGWFDPLARITYNAVFATVGLREQWPLQALALVANLALVAAVFAYCRHLGRPWTGVLVGAALLFMGPAHYSLLWPLNSLNALGLAALPLCLMLLGRDRPRDDLLAIGLLLVAIGFAGPVAVALCPALALWLLLHEGGATMRLLVPAVPFGVYALAYLLLPGFTADQELRTNLRLAPGFVLESAAGAISGVAGIIDTVTAMRPSAAGGMLLALALGALVALWPRLDGPARARVACLGAVALTQWALIAIARAHLGAPTSSRYIILGALPLLLIGVELVRVAPRRAAWGAGTAVALATLVNGIALQDGAANLRAVSDQARAELGAVELVMDSVAQPGSLASVPLLFVNTALWSEARDHLGPTYALGPRELATAEPGPRLAADRALLSLGALTFTPIVQGDAPVGGVCAQAANEQPLVPAAVAVVRPAAPVVVTARRFADAGPPERAVAITPGTALVVAAVDDAGPPWRLAIDGPAEVCIR